MIRTLLVVISLALYVLFLGPAFILHCLLTGRVDRLYAAGVGAAKLALRLGGVRIVREGVENIPAGVCVFVGNHTSNADPPAVVAAIPRRVAMLGKMEVFRVPIVATALRLAQFVPVDRGDADAARESVELALDTLRSGVSFLIFPEGTRSPDARLRPFKKGTFVMAIRAGAPIVPVSVVGAQRVMRKGDFSIHPGEIIVRFHPAVESSEYSLERRDELMARVHAAVAAGLPPEQQPARAFNGTD